MEKQSFREREAVVIGAGLTGLTVAFYARKKGRDVEVLEREDRIGGQIRTYHEAGYTFESGPNTGVVSYPEVAELFADMGEACRLELARNSSKRRLIWKGTQFHALPAGLTAAFRTPLFTWYDKIRIIGEPFRRKGADPNETVGALTVRRLGYSYLRYVVDPFLSGVYAGDPMRLVTRYALPKLYNLEQTYGSFIRGAVAKAKEQKSDRDRLATKKVFSAHGGMGNLVDALGDAIGADRITIGAKGIVLVPDSGRWRVEYTDAGGNACCIRCAKVVTTCGAYSLPALLPFVDKERMKAVNNLYYAPIVQVGVGVADTAGVGYNAFGGLVPSCERQNVLGILYPSACFEGRAPEQGAVFSFFMGGVRRPDFVDKSDEELLAIVDDALHRMLKLPDAVKADAVRIFRHRRAIPQYEGNTGERYAAIDSIERQYTGLRIAGNIRGGIGMADRIRQAVAVAAEL